MHSVIHLSELGDLFFFIPFQVCSDSLEGQTFFSKKDKPLCKKHAHSVNIWCLELIFCNKCTEKKEKLKCLCLIIGENYVYMIF